jgi:hypothetical protein
MAREQRFDAGKTRVDDVRAKVSLILMHTIVFAKKQYHMLSLLCSIHLLALRKGCLSMGKKDNQVSCATPESKN